MSSALPCTTSAPIVIEAIVEEAFALRSIDSPGLGSDAVAVSLSFAVPMPTLSISVGVGALL